MSQISVVGILKLPVQERIHQVEVNWKSIAAFPRAIEVSSELKTELKARHPQRWPHGRAGQRVTPPDALQR